MKKKIIMKDVVPTLWRGISKKISSCLRKREQVAKKRPHFIISVVNNNGSYLLCIYSVWAVSVLRFYYLFQYSTQHYELSATVIFVLQIREWRIKEIEPLTQIKQLTSGRARIHNYSVCIFNF